MMNTEEKGVTFADARPYYNEKLPWSKYRRPAAHAKPLEEHSRDEVVSDTIECPILLAAVPLDQSTLLTCCRRYVSDEALSAWGKSKACPLCRHEPLLTAYCTVSVNRYPTLRGLIGVDFATTTVADMVNLTRIALNLKSSCRILLSLCLDQTGFPRMLRQPDQLLRSYGVWSGSHLFMDVSLS